LRPPSAAADKCSTPEASGSYFRVLN